MVLLICVGQRCTTFLGQGPSELFLGHSRAKDKILSWTFERESSIKTRLFHLISLLIACYFILLPSKLFQIVIHCKIVNSSIRFTFVHKISVIQGKFLVFFNRGLCIPGVDKLTKYWDMLKLIDRCQWSPTQASRQDLKTLPWLHINACEFVIFESLSVGTVQWSSG